MGRIALSRQICALIWSAILIVGIGSQLACAGTAGSAKAGAAQTDPSGKPVVAWDKAMDYVGQEVVVEGTVVATKEIDTAIFVNFHSDYKHTFSIFVPGSKKETMKKAFTDFPGSLEGKKVRIRGMVKTHEKDGATKPEIVLETPDQLTIL